MPLQSTAVRKAVREIPASGVNGVICVDAETDSEFSPQLLDVLGMPRQTTRHYSSEESLSIIRQSLDEAASAFW